MPVARSWTGMDHTGNSPKGGSVDIVKPTVGYAYGFTAPIKFPNTNTATIKLSDWGSTSGGGSSTYAYPIAG